MVSAQHHHEGLLSVKNVFPLNKLQSAAQNDCVFYLCADVITRDGQWSVRNIALYGKPAAAVAPPSMVEGRTKSISQQIGRQLEGSAADRAGARQLTYMQIETPYYLTYQNGQRCVSRKPIVGPFTDDVAPLYVALTRTFFHLTSLYSVSCSYIYDSGGNGQFLIEPLSIVRWRYDVTSQNASNGLFTAWDIVPDPSCMSGLRVQGQEYDIKVPEGQDFAFWWVHCMFCGVGADKICYLWLVNV